MGVARGPIYVSRVLGELAKGPRSVLEFLGDFIGSGGVFRGPGGSSKGS